MQGQPPTSTIVVPGTFTVATLPDATQYARRYVWCTDLHDSQPDFVVSDGAKWKPVRPLATRTVANSDSNVTLNPLMNSPTQIMQGALTAARTLTLTTALAYSGARFRVKREATGLLAMLVNGGAGSIASLGLASWADFEFNGSTWVQTASGGLL